MTEQQMRLERVRHFSMEAATAVCRCGHTGDGADGQHAGAASVGWCMSLGCDCERFVWGDWSEAFVRAVKAAAGGAR